MRVCLCICVSVCVYIYLWLFIMPLQNISEIWLQDMLRTHLCNYMFLLFFLIYFLGKKVHETILFFLFIFYIFSFHHEFVYLTIG